MNKYNYQIELFPDGSTVRTTKPFAHLVGQATGPELMKEPIPVGTEGTVQYRHDDGRAVFDLGQYGVHTFSVEDPSDVPLEVVQGEAPAELAREKNLEEAKQFEIERHQYMLEDLQREYQRRLEDENRRYANKLHDIQRAAAGERVPGMCPVCGYDYRVFHRRGDYEQCPRCGADLSGGTED